MVNGDLDFFILLSLVFFSEGSGICSSRRVQFVLGQTDVNVLACLRFCGGGCLTAQQRSSVWVRGLGVQPLLKSRRSF